LTCVVLLRPLPQALAGSATTTLSCVAWAGLKSDYLEMLSAAGFANVQVVGENLFYFGEAAADPIVVLNCLTMKAELAGQIPENSFVPCMAAGASCLGIRV
jgi:hypothetical protein